MRERERVVCERSVCERSMHAGDNARELKGFMLVPAGIGASGLADRSPSR